MHCFYLNSTQDWGRIPVVVIFGGDYQLPSFGPGAVDSLICQGNARLNVKVNGTEFFKILGKTTMELTQIMHQNEDKIEFKAV